MSDPTFVAILRSWSFPPTVVLGLALAAMLYGRGLRSTPRQAQEHATRQRWRAVAYYSGLVTLAIALMSPVAPLGGLLFSAHMVQHMLLAIVAAPLLVLGAPLGPVLRGLPRSVRAELVRAFLPGRPLPRAADWVTRPVIAAAAHAVTIWFWHVPAMYDATLRVELLHYLQHATIFGTALLFWWPVAQPVAGRRLPHGLALIYLTAGMVVQHKLIGAFLTFARQPLYPYYTQVPRLWGFSALNDQQTAGLIMSTGGFMIIWIAFTAVFIVWAREASRDEMTGRTRHPRSQRSTPTVPVATTGANGHVHANGVNGRAMDAQPADVRGRAAP